MNVDVDFCSDESVLQLIIQDEKYGIRKRMEVLFRLRTIETLEAIYVLEDTLRKEKSSDLLRHEICYCLGQMTSTEENKKEIQNFLEDEVFTEPDRYPSIVLHEAAEALGNISSENNKKLLERFVDYDDEIIRETCEISVANLEWMISTDNGKAEGLDKEELEYKTNDPAPPFNFKKDEQYRDLTKISKIMHDEKETMFNRYRAIFTLREMNTDEAVKVLCECFDKEQEQKFSPLFKHEVAYILGQMAYKAKSALESLELVLKDEEEHPIVRHEGALALGEISKSKKLL